MRKLNLDSAVRDDKAMQAFASESLLIGDNYDAKACIALSSLTAES